VYVCVCLCVCIRTCADFIVEEKGLIGERGVRDGGGMEGVGREGQFTYSFGIVSLHSSRSAALLGQLRESYKFGLYSWN
jgi:hypothetical protein